MLMGLKRRDWCCVHKDHGLLAESGAAASLGTFPLPNPHEVASVYHDILTYLHWLHDVAHVVHGDVCLNNIMYLERDGRIYGVLNDCDSAIKVNDSNSGTHSSQQSAGTKP
ncbi:uncharacterized protein EI90DRAFT_3052329 [Cantharellus anzutake]|uniref:uncharacterized protein n=1 Tax=Cantharellus anzutake TaxID=1750568 RepID=UPI0019083EF4|nr:uncharacterized protein EI90DRAFT_3052329 [Cantharellus anzutake]KAF8333542.1 hypothetical protein EI90DRAFT_3052329 [Cantharellus anzutake]